MQIDDSNNNLLRSSSATSTEYYDTCIVRRGFRAGKYVATFRFKWSPGPSPGFLVRWVNPGDWLAVIVKAADSKAWVYKRVNDGILQSPLSSGSTVSLTNGNWYTGKVVVGDDLGNSALQRLRFWIDTDDDGTWSDESALLDTTTVDDDWSAGHAGLFHGHIASTAAQDFDDVKIGLDLNADLDLDDTADSLVINDDFASNSTTLSYDDNGNLTDDGIFKFAYDAWNRLVGVKSRYTASTTQTTFATYAYDGANRRNSKVVANNGVEVYPNDGGNTTVHFYYDDEWRIVETRNGSNQATWQHLWGTQYIDELIRLDKNGDPTIGNDTDPDGTAGESSESPADHRYFAHQDRNWNVLALTDYGDGVDSDIVERCALRTPYGAYLVTRGNAASAELGSVSLQSRIGTAFVHQGLWSDPMTGLIQNRHRERSAQLSRFIHPDPTGFSDGHNLFAFAASLPVHATDARGLTVIPPAGNVDPGGGVSRGCQARFRTHTVFVPFKRHVGLDIDTNGDGVSDKTVDYGWDGADDGEPVDICCGCQNNTPQRTTPPEWPLRNNPFGSPEYPEGDKWHALGSCACHCLSNPTPNYNKYCLFGCPLIVDCSNSAGALHAELDRCLSACTGVGSHGNMGPTLPPPSWINDRDYPGWDNVPDGKEPDCGE